MTGGGVDKTTPHDVSIQDHLADREEKDICMYSNFRNYAPPLDVKGGIIAEKVVPVFSESSFLACFGLVM